MEGSDAPGIVTPQEKTPQGDSSEVKEAQLTEGGTKRKGEGVPQRKGQTKRRRMARGQVMSLHRALGGGTSSEEEDEVDEEPLSIWKGGRKPQSVFFSSSLKDAGIPPSNIPIICRHSQMEILIAAHVAASVCRYKIFHGLLIFISLKMQIIDGCNS